MDTTVYDQNSHNYLSAAITKLEELIRDKKVKLYITTITTGEVESHIRRDVDAAQANIQVTFNKYRFLKHSMHESVSKVFEGMDVEEVIDDLCGQFRFWLTAMSVEYIPLEGVSIEGVFDKYFVRKPPFSEKKKEEFPDAFNLAVLEKWCEERKTKMYVISGDGDMASACKTIDSLQYVKSLSVFLEMYAKEEPLANYASELFEKHKKEIINLINDKMYMHLYWPTEYNEQLVFSYAEDIRLPEKHLIEVEDGKAIFDVVISVSHFARIRQPQFGFMNMGGLLREVTKRRNEHFKGEVSLLFDTEDESKFKIEYVNIKEDLLYFPHEDYGYVEYDE